MIYKAEDIWNSPSLAHHGVKGMKWGVRKSVERTGRVVRKMGGAVKNSASRIAGGLVRTGSAIRRFKNRRAIKSGNANRIQSRVDKMSTQELTDAVTRAHLVSQLHNGGNSNSISLGDTVANSLKRKIGDMAANALQTTVTSALRGESPLSAMARNAKAEKVQQEQQISNNRLQTISNNYRIGNSALQNQADIAKLNIQIASSNDRIQSLAKSQAPISSIKQTYSMPTGRRYVRRKLNSSNTYRYALYQDDMGVDEFLAHYGVKGMKWGVRKSEYSLERDTSRNGKVNSIKKGDYIYRISSKADSNGGSVLYGSANEEENNKWARHLFNKHYSQKYIANNNIKIADEETLNKTYSDLFLKSASNRKKVRDALMNPISGSGRELTSEIKKSAHQYFEKNPDSAFYEFAIIDGKQVDAKKAFSISLKNRDEYNKKLKDGSFRWEGVMLDKPLIDARAAASLYRVNPDHPVTKSLTKALKKKGYTAVTDIRGYDYAESPIIFLDKNQLQLKESKRIVQSYDFKEKYKGLGIKKYYPSKARKERDALIEDKKYYTDYKKYN